LGYPGIRITLLIAGSPGVGSILSKNSDGLDSSGNLKAGFAAF
jgi:hypothetical protein